MKCATVRCQVHPEADELHTPYLFKMHFNIILTFSRLGFRTVVFYSGFSLFMACPKAQTSRSFVLVSFRPSVWKHEVQECTSDWLADN